MIPSFAWTQPYSIPYEFYREGFDVFQKKYFKRRSTIMMILFLLIMVTFIAAAVKEPTNKMCYILIMISFAGACLQWYNPRKQRRNILDAVKELSEDTYTSTCDGKVFRVVYNPPEGDVRPEESRVLLEQAYIQEFEQYWLICDGKKMFYILPKDATTKIAETEEQA